MVMKMITMTKATVISLSSSSYLLLSIPFGWMVG